MQIKIKKTFLAPLLVLVIFILFNISKFIDVYELKYKDNIYLSVIILQMLIFILPGIFYSKVRGKELIEKIKFGTMNVRKIMFSVFSFFTLFFGSALIKLALYEIGYYSDKYTLYEKYIPQDTASLKNVLYIIIAIAILPAITEEFVFRGIVLSEYRLSGCNCAASILISSLLFAMMHFDIYQFPVFLFGGIILGCTFCITDSLFAAILVHTLNNSISLLFEKQILKLIAETDSMVFILFVLSVLFIIFLLLCLHEAEIIYYTLGINGAKSYEGMPKKFKKADKASPAFEAFLSPTFLICILFFVIFTFGIK